MPFVYACTGTNDDLVIQYIVNDFFATGTAMSMKLIVTGFMAGNNKRIVFSEPNARGATCHLDFSDCTVEPNTVAGSDFLTIQSGVSNISITGLNVSTNRTFLNIHGDNCTLRDCRFTATGTTPQVMSTPAFGYGGKGLSVHNCKIAGVVYVFEMFAGAGDCTFYNCEFGRSASNGIAIRIPNNTENPPGSASFMFCNIIGGTSAVRIESSNPNSVYRFYGCTIQNVSTGNCILLGAIGGTIIFDGGCVILGSATAQSLTFTSSATTASCLILNNTFRTGQAISIGSGVGTSKLVVTGNQFNTSSINVRNTDLTSDMGPRTYIPAYANTFS